MTKQINGVPIQSVEDGSIAQEVGIEAGDRLLAVNDREIEDALDYRYVAGLLERVILLRIAKASGDLWDIEIEKNEEDDLGIELEGIQTRICKNNCIFCFVHQLPRGKHIRRTLRVKDEDFRLSFLFGHYLTLTNLSEHDFERIFEQRLSPLYVSVHSTEPDLRQYLLQNRKPDDLLGNIRRLVDGGIRLHTQIVLIPEINDGLHLERSIADLLQFHPGVLTVSIVPVGLTEHRKGLPQLKAVDAAYAQKTIQHVSGIQRRILRIHKTPFCFLGDEFYLMAGEAIPPRSHYGEFPLVENGVGMVRTFLDEFSVAFRRKWKPRPGRIRGTVVTGKAFYPVLQDCLSQMNSKFKTELTCLPVNNLFFGQGITVAGLLTGGDILAAVKDQLQGDFLVIPSESLTGDQGLFLDDRVRGDLQASLGVHVFGGGYHVAEFFESIFAPRLELRNRPAAFATAALDPQI